jgi:SlyX protein
MNDASNIDRRLTDLEIKASYSDDLLDELNKLVAKQQTQIDSLLRELSMLRRQAHGGDAVDAGSTRNLRDELPPHY